MNKTLKKWIKCASIRAIKTIAQTAIASIGTSMAMGDVNWIYVGSTSLLAGILSILTSIAGLPEVKEDWFMEEISPEELMKEIEENESEIQDQEV